AYLTNYPGGQFRSLALARIAALQNGTSTQTRAMTTGVDPAIYTEQGNMLSEDQIGLNRNQRRDVQRRLTGLGFDTKASGNFDATTRNVIKRWQAARGYPESGFLTKLQYNALATEITPEKSASGGDDRPAPAPRQRSRRQQQYNAAGGAVII